MPKEEITITAEEVKQEVHRARWSMRFAFETSGSPGNEAPC